ncbi:MAG TPA: hypothetical protein VM784_14790 [Actinomycetota bacterium]|nr:hypothetical protein [Actinomycetota bacterium]
MRDRIQHGIYHRHDEKPPPAYRLLLLNIRRGATSEETRRGLAEIWNMLNDLMEGHVRDLQGQPEPHLSATRSQFSSLDALISYGRRFFDGGLHDPHLSKLACPSYLAYLDRESPFPALAWSPQSTVGECDIAFQFTAHSVAAVNCAAVEVWKLTGDRGLPLEVVATYDGFGRVDGRGWLEFHDGVSNMPSQLRTAALQARTDPEWMEGGTYMVYLRIRVDLETWRKLDRAQQETAVGRDKLTGSALQSIEEGPEGEIIPIARPFPDVDASPEEQTAWRDPPETTHPLIEASHVHRANQTRASPGAPGSLRMFRQGYEFLAGIGPDGPHLGLNFVSFQRDLRVFQHVMHLPGWLGDVNFGGESGSANVTRAPSFLTLDAGGFYAVPPQAQGFPGATLFDT